MTSKKPPRPRQTAKPSAKDERLAKALRANLKRRKAPGEKSEKVEKP